MFVSVPYKTSQCLYNQVECEHDTLSLTYDVRLVWNQDLPSSLSKDIVSFPRRAFGSLSSTSCDGDSKQELTCKK